MLVHIIFNQLFLLAIVSTVQIPYIDNAIFIANSNSSDITVINKTCDQCLCMSIYSYTALNCFPNNTCQFFNTFPQTYKIQWMSQARLYFPQKTFPNQSQCCVSNTSYLLNKLNTTTPIIATVSQPRCLVLDNNGYLVTISQANFTIVRFYPTNLTIVDQPLSPVFTNTPMTITYYNEAYYVGFEYFILVIDSNNFNILNNLTTSALSGTRGMIFLNNGQTMVVASTDNNAILFFNRSNLSTDYNFVNGQSVNYSYPHGFWYINDTYFYVTSWGGNAIYSYSAIENSILWREQLFLNANPIAPTAGGDHLTIDECNRYWFSLGSNGIRIFDNQGFLIGNFTQITPFVFDTLITDDYILYLSDTQSNKIIRINPNIQCSLT